MASPAVPMLVTDSCCDLPRDLTDSLGVVVLDYPVILDGEEHTGHDGSPLTAADFYGRVRDGALPSTAAIPIPWYVDAFSEGAREGRPVILVGLSAALSGTFDRALMARAVEEIFCSYHESLTGREPEFGGCIDWQELADRMAEEMEGDRYMKSVISGGEEGTEVLDGPHLGVQNGPFPVPELISAIHIASLFSVRELGC